MPNAHHFLISLIISLFHSVLSDPQSRESSPTHPAVIGNCSEHKYFSNSRKNSTQRSTTMNMDNLGGSPTSNLYPVEKTHRVNLNPYTIERTNHTNLNMYTVEKTHHSDNFSTTKSLTMTPTESGNSMNETFFTSSQNHSDNKEVVGEVTPNVVQISAPDV